MCRPVDGIRGSCERAEWRAIVWPLAALLSAFGAGWVYAAYVGVMALEWAVAIPYGIGLAWLVRAAIGWYHGSTAILDGARLLAFRERVFWSRPARCSYAMVLVCDGLFLLELAPGAPVLFFALAVLAAFFAREVGLPSIVLGAWYLL